MIGVFWDVLHVNAVMISHLSDVLFRHCGLDLGLDMGWVQ